MANKDPLGTIYQGVDINQHPESEGKFVSYGGSWIAVSYINMMIDNDDTDTMKIKTLISYLHNNACELGQISGWNLKESMVYFIDVITMDLYKKLGYDSLETLSLSEIIDTYYRAGCVAETMLLKAIDLGDNPSELLTYLSITEEEFYKPKTTTFTDASGTKLPGQDSTTPKITFTDDINATFELYKTTSTKTNMWVSDKTPNNQLSGQGVTTYGLTNLWFKPTVGNSRFIDNPSLLNSTGAINWAIEEDKYEAITESQYNTEELKPRKNNGSILNDKINEDYTTIKSFITSDRKFIYVRWITLYNNTTLTQANAPNIKVAPNWFKIPTEEVIKTRYAATYVEGEYDDYINYGIATPGTTIGHPKGAQFDWKKANSTIRKPYTYPAEPSGTTKDDHYIVSYGGIGKTKKHAFYKIIKTSEATPSDALKINNHSFISGYGYGKDTGDPDKDILHDFTVRNSTTGQTSGVDILLQSTSNAGSVIDGWVSPLPGVPTSVSKFGLRNGKEHEGIDLRAVQGTEVYSSYDGIIVAAGLLNSNGYGNVVVIQHQDVNLTTIYGHLSEFNFTESGTQISKPVKAGELIGKSGGTKGTPGAGNSKDPHLHYEIRKGLATNYSSSFSLTSTDPEPYIIGDNTTTNSNVATPGSIQTGNTADFWSLLAICALEDGYPQGRADVAQSIYNRVGSPMYQPTIAEVIKYKAGYQPAFANAKGDISQNFANIKDKTTAIKALADKQYKKSSDPTAAATKALKETWEALKDPNNQNNAKQLIQGRTDFKAEREGSVTSRNANLKSDGRGIFVQRKQKDNVYGWSYNYITNTTYGPPAQTFWDLGSNSF
jgi:murein DD-endopeptidase MepM/ murein hydrolase activator NlpD